MVCRCGVRGVLDLKVTGERGQGLGQEKLEARKMLENGDESNMSKLGESVHTLLSNRSFVPEKYRQQHRNKNCPDCIIRQVTCNPNLQIFERLTFPDEANIVNEYSH